ncbi:MAG: hypothetical protein IKG69_00535 [Atopobiaceae bacterium]|nr:hypothetical protein [Atopobiaceae bacterium]
MNFYDSIIAGGQRWPKRAREELNTAVLEYLALGTVPDLDSMNQYAAGAFEMFRPVLDHQIASAEAGKRGAEAKRTKQRKAASKPPVEQATKPPSKPPSKAASKPPDEQAELFQASPLPYEQEQEQDKEKDAPNGAKKKPHRFVPPEPDEVEAYARERGLSIDAQRFCDFYASKGWMVGRNHMVNWKAAASNWARRDAPAAPQGDDPFAAYN